MFENLERGRPYYNETELFEENKSTIFVGTLNWDKEIVDIWYNTEKPEITLGYAEEVETWIPNISKEEERNVYSLICKIAKEKDIIISDTLWIEELLETRVDENIYREKIINIYAPKYVKWSIEQATEGLKDIEKYILQNSKEKVHEKWLNMQRDGTRTLSRKRDRKAVTSVNIKIKDKSIAHEIAAKIVKEVQNKNGEKTIPVEINVPLSRPIETPLKNGEIREIKERWAKRNTERLGVIGIQIERVEKAIPVFMIFTEAGVEHEHLPNQIEGLFTKIYCVEYTKKEESTLDSVENEEFLAQVVKLGIKGVAKSHGVSNGSISRRMKRIRKASERLGIKEST